MAPSRRDWVTKREREVRATVFPWSWPGCVVTGAAVRSRQLRTRRLDKLPFQSFNLSPEPGYLTLVSFWGQSFLFSVTLNIWWTVTLELKGNSGSG